MTYATKTSGAWVAVPYGQTITNADGAQASYATVESWPKADQEAWGAFKVPDPDAPPAGKVEASRVLGGDATPVWTVTYVNAPPPPVYDPHGLIATLKGAIDGDGGVGGVDNATGLQAAMELQPGVYWFFFAQALPDANYIVQPGYTDSDLIFDLKSTDQEPDFVEVTAVDRATGEPARPACISVTVFR